MVDFVIAQGGVVSTHSRLKAAGLPSNAPTIPLRRFNTQPPEGGWGRVKMTWIVKYWFQHTAA